MRHSRWLLLRLVVGVVSVASILCASVVAKEHGGEKLVGRVEDLAEELKRHLHEEGTSGLSSALASQNCSTQALLSHWPNVPLWQPWSLPSALTASFPTRESATLDPSRFQLHIKLLTFDRVGATARLLKSLKNADYLGDTVSLEIFVDNPFSPVDGWGRRKGRQQAIALKARRAMLGLLDRFQWPHGPKAVHARALNSGTQPQWMEAWWPETVNDIAFIAEDDLEVSPLFYVYLKRLVMFYYYNQSNFNPHVYGISFQRQYLVPGYYGNKMAAPGEPFLYHLIGTWGQFVFPIPWKNYRMWYDDNRYASSRGPGIGNMITTLFWKQRGNRIWTPWQVRWAYVRHMYNLYTGFPTNLSLSVSHRTSGENIKHTLGPDALLLTPSSLSSQSLPPSAYQDVSTAPSSVLPHWWTSLPSMRKIKKFDWCFRAVPNLGVPLSTLSELRGVLPAFAGRHHLAVIPMTSTIDAYRRARNWLCHVDGLNRHNYLFLFELMPTSNGSSLTPVMAGCNKEALEWNKNTEKYATDLAARGHLVYIIPAAAQEPKAEDCSASAMAQMKQSVFSLSKASFVKQLLERGPSILISTLGTIWKRDPFKCVPTIAGNSPFSLWAAAGNSSSEKIGIVSFISWVKNTQEGVSQYQQFLEKWHACGVPELSLLPKTMRGEFRSLLHLNLATVQNGSCISDFSDSKKSNTSIFLLRDSNVATLKALSLWKVDDAYSSCLEVICRKKLG